MKKSIITFSLLVLVCVAFAQQNITFLSNKPYPYALANIWGYATGGSEYALVGTFQGLSIVDVTTPTAPLEVATVAGSASEWREVKTKDHYAFVTTEGGANGLQIVDLAGLPGSVLSHNWTPTINGVTLKTIHALHVDGNYLYLYGSNINGGATLMVDVTDPWNPVYINTYVFPGGGTFRYVHDGIVKNDTMYEGHIYNGFFAVVDVVDKMNPHLIASQSTPTNFTHNTWLSDNGKVLFTTDENSNSYLSAYDMSDMSNITLMDKVQATPGSGSIVHNTLVTNDFCVTSWYKDGVYIVDGHRPQNLIVTGYYDTYPSGSGDGFNGDWGVYPYLPSGNLLVSDIDNGLFVLGPTYVRASYLEGNITDSICGTVIKDALIEILSTTASDLSDLQGNYKTGVAGSGTYDVRISRAGYTTKVITGVNMIATQVTTLNVALGSPNIVHVNGITNDSLTASALANVNILIENDSNSYSLSSDASGVFGACNVLSGIYTITAGKWGYKTKCLGNQAFTSTVNNVTFDLAKGIYDDFTFDYGWTVNGTSGNKWERSLPVSTLDTVAGQIANPGADAGGDCSRYCFITDNNGGGPWDHDVDGGNTVLTSPVFDLSGMGKPIINYSRWFYDGGFLNGSPNDSMKISISNGTTSAVLETIMHSDIENGTWAHRSIQVPTSLSLTTTMKLIVSTADINPANIVEGGFDAFEVTEASAASANDAQNSKIKFSVSPNPFKERTELISVGLENWQEALNVKISDICGKVIMTRVLKREDGIISIGAELSAGVYMLQVTSDNGIFFHNQKLIKMN